MNPKKKYILPTELRERVSVSVEKIIIDAAAPPKATNLNIFIYLSSRICISHTHVCTYFRYIFKKFSKRHIRCSDFEIQQKQPSTATSAAIGERTFVAVLDRTA